MPGRKPGVAPEIRAGRARSLRLLYPRFVFSTHVLGLVLLGSLAVQETPASPLRAVADGETANEASISGRYVYPDGTPGAGLALNLRGFPINPSVPDDESLWRDLAAVTDADGRFAFSFEPSPNHRVELAVEAGEYAVEDWMWPRLEAGTVCDLGDLPLRPFGALTGIVENADGGVLRGNWTVNAICTVPPGIQRKGVCGRPMQIRQSFRAEETDERFVFEGLLAGEVRFLLVIDTFGRVEVDPVELAPGEVEDVVFTYEGPDLNERVLVDVNLPVNPYAYPELDYVALRTPAGSRVAPLPNRRGRKGFAFDGLAPGEYVFELDDPRFEPVRLEGLQPGSSPELVTLVGNSALRIAVTDAETGDVPERCEIRMRLDDGTFAAVDDPWRLGERYEPGTTRMMRPTSYRIKLPDRDVPARNVYDGLIAGDYTLVVSAPGYATAFVPVPGLAPGELRELPIALGHGGTVEGRVLTSRGTSAGMNIRVALFVPGEETRGPLGHEFLVGEPGPELLGQGLERASAKTDVEGRFRFENVAAGTYVAKPIGRPGEVASVPLTVTEQGRVEIVLEL